MSKIGSTSLNIIRVIAFTISRINTTNSLILSLSTPPPVLGRLPQRRCALLPLIVWGFVCKGSNIDCPYFEGAAARSRKSRRWAQQGEGMAYSGKSG